jgi:UrcA family protein
MTNRCAILALCAVAGTTLALGSVQQAAAAGMPTVRVSYPDLDLSRPADAYVLYTRLRRAAATVCPGAPTYELARFAAYQRCVKVVLADAVRRVHSITLERAADAGATGIVSLRR